MGLLDGGLQRVALGAFGAILMTGRFQRVGDVQVRDDRGRIIEASRFPPVDCKAFFEKVTDQMRANGYQNRDVQIVMLQLTPSGEQIPEPVEGDYIVLRGQNIRVAAPIDQDPAMAAWTFRGTPMDPPGYAPPDTQTLITDTAGDFIESETGGFILPEEN